MKLQTATAKLTISLAVASYLHKCKSILNWNSSVMYCTIIPHSIISMLCVLGYENPVPSLRLLSHCFCPSGKAKPLLLHASKNSVSCSFSSPKQESTSSSPSSSKPEYITSRKSITPVLNITTSTSTLHHAPPPAPPLAPVVRPRRPHHQEVLKPVVLVLPPVQFPNFFPPQHSRIGFSPSINYNKWRSPVQLLSCSSFSKDAMVKSRPPFWAHKLSNTKIKEVLTFVPNA